MDWFTDAFSGMQQWLFEALLQPAVFALGLGNWLEDAYDATGWLLVGMLQLLILAGVLGPLQRWRPVEPVTDRAAIRTDLLYTLLHRLGLFRLGLFFTLEPLLDGLFGQLRLAGLHTFQLDSLWPGVTDLALVSLAIYLVTFDFIGYWIHRGQHHFEWWWRLHALHHSQRQLTMWSDNRNHLLDDLLHDSLLLVAAQFIGIAPGQFIAVVALTQLSENLQHANLRLWFGRVGERLWISPRFHRMHHAAGIGHESPARPRRAAAPETGLGPPESGASPAAAPSRPPARLGGYNFGVLLPWWDMLFGTANFERGYHPTGIRDQLEQGRDYGRGFWAQQWLGLKRLAGHA